ncbi:MAG: hypothetical protein KME46_20765 [Brasilonema angustatum HA4187-MV1]|nr:hypothetical protein [Brasilonema angustatum HA4187-MV1]
MLYDPLETEVTQVGVPPATGGTQLRGIRPLHPLIATSPKSPPRRQIRSQSADNNRRQTHRETNPPTNRPHTRIVNSFHLIILQKDNKSL